MLGEALQYAPKLRQLALLYPTSYQEDEITEYLQLILPRMRPSTVLKVVGGAGIGVDEAEFWETPDLCIAEEISERVRVVVTGVETVYC